MKLAANFMEAIRQMEQERGIAAHHVIGAIEAALEETYKRRMIEQEKLLRESEIYVHIDTEKNEVRVKWLKDVAETPENLNEVSLEEARKKREDAEVGEQIEVELPLTSKDFERLTVSSRQAITQKLREAQKLTVLEEYKDRIGTMVTATVQRLEKKNVIVKLDNKSELVLPAMEQLPKDHFRYNDKIRVYLAEIRENNRTPYILISRTHAGLVKCLFEIEIPEVADGTVQIKSIARDAGFRTKIAVTSLKGNVDPVGACIGSRGSRIHPIIDELKGEKIDVVRWSEDIGEFITNALSPAKVFQVQVNEEECEAVIVVPDDQLSLAIGREGQNVRLAAQLTHYRLDIITESQLRQQKQEIQQAMQEQFYDEEMVEEEVDEQVDEDAQGDEAISEDDSEE